MNDVVKSNHQSSHATGCLARVPIFNRLDQKTTEAITELIRPSYYQKGEIIQPYHSTTPRLLILNRGKAKVIRTSPDGKEQIIEWLNPGDFTGEVSVFTDEPSDSEIIALEDTSFCTIDGEKLKGILADSPQLALKVIRTLSQRLSKSQQQLESLGLLPTDQKLLNRLIELAAGQTEFKLPMTKKDLAAELGMAPETLSRKLKQLSDSGIIALDKPHIIKLME